MESIITAIITGGVTLLGVLIANGFARRMPVVEEQIRDPTTWTWSRGR